MLYYRPYMEFGGEFVDGEVTDGRGVTQIMFDFARADAEGEEPWQFIEEGNDLVTAIVPDCEEETCIKALSMYFMDNDIIIQES